MSVRQEILVFFLVLSVLAGRSQKNDFTPEVIQHKGKLLKIFDPFPSTNGTTTTELNFHFKGNGKKYWHAAYGYPQFGCSIAFTTYGNQRVLGYSWSVQPNIVLEKQFQSGWGVGNRMGLGIAYFNRPFEELSNPTNEVVGSHVTAAVSENFFISKSIKDQWKISLGGALWHWSNGHTKVPNIGANILNFSVGLKYQFSKTAQIKKQLDSINKKVGLELGIGWGFHGIEGTTQPTGGPTYSVYTGTIALTKRVKQIFKPILGIDYHYYSDYYAYNLNEEIILERLWLNATNLVVFVGNEFLFGRLALSTQIGVNLFNPLQNESQKFKDSVFANKSVMELYNANRIGFKYYLSTENENLRKKPFIGIDLKTIAGKADFVQLKFGISI